MVTADIKVLFGNRVRELRRRRGWSQEGFAQQVGLDRSYMGGVERGERNVSIENIALIANGLDVTLSELFDLGEPPASAESNHNTSGGKLRGDRSRTDQGPDRGRKT